MWSLGVIIFSLVSGKNPFPNYNDKNKLIIKICTCDFEFGPKEFWKKISPECISFIN